MLIMLCCRLKLIQLSDCGTNHEQPIVHLIKVVIDGTRAPSLLLLPMGSQKQKHKTHFSAERIPHSGHEDLVVLNHKQKPQ